MVVRDKYFLNHTSIIVGKQEGLDIVGRFIDGESTVELSYYPPGEPNNHYHIELHPLEARRLRKWLNDFFEEMDK